MQEKDYLLETECIDFSNPLIQQKTGELKSASSSQLEYIEKAYKFVRDERLVRILKESKNILEVTTDFSP